MAGKKIGILALQGAFIEHETMLKKCGVNGIQIRKAEQIAAVDGLIIPGGESTVIGKLMGKYDILDVVLRQAQAGMPIWGTCAGMIIMAKDIVGYDQVKLGLMDMKVKRNAFGRQIESFEADLDITALGSVHGVFIRAPYAEEVWGDASILCSYRDRIVMVRQGNNLLATAFHPELTGDPVIHDYFLSMA